VTDDLFQLLHERGPEGLVGATTDVEGVPHEIMALKAAGAAMLVYNLRNVQTNEQGHVLKIPRARPGTQEYERVVRSHRLAMERIPDLIAPTQAVRLGMSDLAATAPSAALRDALNQGTAALLAGQSGRALELFEHALLIEPDNILALHNKGGALAAEERYEEAITCFNRVLELDPDDCDALTNRARLLFRQKELAAAFRDFKNVLKHKPDHAESWNGLGRVLGANGQLDSAEECFTNALSADPDNSEARELLSLTRQMRAKTKE
jgi:tetratricopeptide (TPR) repeat protein